MEMSIRSFSAIKNMLLNMNSPISTFKFNKTASMCLIS